MRFHYIIYIDYSQQLFNKKRYHNHMLLKRIGNNVRFLRKKANLSQIDLAVAAGIDRAYLSEIENGHRNITIMLLQNLATVLNVSIEDLLKSPK